MKIFTTFLIVSLGWISFVTANTVVNVSNFTLPDGPALPIANVNGYVDSGKSWAVGRYTGNLNAAGISPAEAWFYFDRNGSEGGFLQDRPGFIESSVIDAQTSPDATDRFTDPMQGGPWPIVILFYSRMREEFSAHSECFKEEPTPLPNSMGDWRWVFQP